MDLRHLKAFLHVADLGGLSRAAARLNLTQPALSRQIRLLEEDLGTRLFRRTGRGAVLTDAGQRFEARVRPLVADLEAAAAEIAEPSGELRGEVSLAIPPTLADAATAGMLRDFHRRHPAVAIRLTVALSGVIHDGLLRGRFDMGVLFHPRHSRGLTADDLWTETLDLVGPATMDLARDRPWPLAEVAGLPLILPGARHGLRMIVEAAALDRGVTLNVVMEVESLRMELELARLGVGCTLLPRRAYTEDLAAGRLSAAPIIDPPLTRGAALARAADRRRSPAAAALAESVRRAAGR